MCSQKRGTKRRLDSFVNNSTYLKFVPFCHAGNSNHKQEYLRSLNEDTDRRSAERMILFELGQRWTFNKKSNHVFWEIQAWIGHNEIKFLILPLLLFFIYKNCRFSELKTFIVYIYIYVCVCVCVCVLERERERENNTVAYHIFRPNWTIFRYYISNIQIY